MEKLIQIYHTKKYTKNTPIIYITLENLPFIKASHILYVYSYIYYKDTKYLYQDFNEFYLQIFKKKKRVHRNIDLEVLVNTLFLNRFNDIEAVRADSLVDNVENPLFSNPIVDSFNFNEIETLNNSIEPVDITLNQSNIHSSVDLNCDPVQSVRNKRIKFNDEVIEMDLKAIEKLRDVKDILIHKDISENSNFSEYLFEKINQKLKNEYSEVECARDNSYMEMCDIMTNDISFNNNFCNQEFNNDVSLNVDNKLYVESYEESLEKQNSENNCDLSFSESFIDCEYKFESGNFNESVKNLSRLDKVKIFYKLLKMAGSGLVTVNQYEFDSSIFIEPVN